MEKTVMQKVLIMTCPERWDWHPQKLVCEIKAFDSELQVIFLLSSWLHAPAATTSVMRCIIGHKSAKAVQEALGSAVPTFGECATR